MGTKYRQWGKPWLMPVCVFDVNETLLDMAALDGEFERVFGDAAVRPLWFSQMLQLALTATITCEYRPFGAHAIAALEMLGARRGVAIGDDERAAVRSGMTALPAHADVRPALERLRASGVRLATLTNSTLEVAEAQLSFAGLRDLFELSLSADTVGRLKPAPEPYLHAASALGVPVSEVLMVAAHAWDVAGAMAAGTRAAFVARPGMVPDPGARSPEFVVGDLGELASRLV
jgi:2-haloacid dehalogenase